MVTAMYFSPTKTTKKITEAVAAGIGEFGSIDLTNPLARKMRYMYGEEDILVLGYPVYGGRIPNVLNDILGKLTGEKTKVVIIGVYGNRAFEDALVEAQDLLSERGFRVIAAGAFIGEHSYTDKVATARPDSEDLEIAKGFGKQIAEKLAQGDISTPDIPGNRPYKKGMPDMPFVPQATENCNSCGACINVCPVQAIDKTNPQVTNSQCILCCACIKTCTKNAKYLDAEPIRKIVGMLESNCLERKEAEMFL